jgi:ribonuclease HI
VVSIYTDGSCLGNTNVATTRHPCGWGAAVVVAGELVAELFGPVLTSPLDPMYVGAEVTSNNTGELTAIIEALWWVRDGGADEVAGGGSGGGAGGAGGVGGAGSGGSSVGMLSFDGTGGHRRVGVPVVIYYDSKYAANITDGTYNAKKNQRLAKQARRLHADVCAQRKLSFVHVKGHSGHRWNDKADELANRGGTGAHTSVGRWGAAGKTGKTGETGETGKAGTVGVLGSGIGGGCSIVGRGGKKRAVVEIDDDEDEDEEAGEGGGGEGRRGRGGDGGGAVDLTEDGEDSDPEWGGNRGVGGGYGGEGAASKRRRKGGEVVDLTE